LVRPALLRDDGPVFSPESTGWPAAGLETRSMSEGRTQGNLLAVAEEKLDRLLKAYGIAREFIGFSGEVAQIPLDNRLRILAALGIAPQDEADVDRLLEEQKRLEWARWMQAVVAVDEDHPRLPLVLPQGREELPMRWRVELEDGN